MTETHSLLIFILCYSSISVPPVVARSTHTHTPKPTNVKISAPVKPKVRLLDLSEHSGIM